MKDLMKSNFRVGGHPLQGRHPLLRVRLTLQVRFKRVGQLLQVFFVGVGQLVNFCFKGVGKLLQVITNLGITI